MANRLRKTGGALVAVLLAVSFGGCTAVRIGPGRGPTAIVKQGSGTAYVTVDGLRPYDGDFVQIDLFTSSQPNGEILNLDVWPIAGVGLGLFGARAHLAILGAGAGTVFYHPVPEGLGSAAGKPVE